MEGGEEYNVCVCDNKIFFREMGSGKWNEIMKNKNKNWL